MKNNKPRKTVFMRRCKRCNIIFKTNTKFSKICPKCCIPKGPKKQRRKKMIEKAFKKSGVFCFNNWQDNYCIELRRLLEKLTNFGNKTYKSKDFIIEYKWYADNKYYFITYKPEHFFYIVTWYKSRGNTESILFQGQLINLDEMEYLLKKIRKEEK